jgi:hypothetical protein
MVPYLFQIQARTALAAGVSVERIGTFDDPATLMNALLIGAIDAHASVVCAHRATLAHRPDDAFVLCRTSTRCGAVATRALFGVRVCAPAPARY